MKKFYFLYWILAFAFFIFYYLPIILFGKETYIIIHDNLDGEFISKILLTLKQGVYFHNEKIFQVMNGLPKEMLNSDRNLVVFLFKKFDPFTAYVLNDLFARIIGFIGMTLLLKDYFIVNNKFKGIGIVFIASLSFSLLGVYNIYGATTVLGQPLLFWSIYNIYRGKTILNYLIIIGYVFCSSFYLVGMFICMLILGYCIYLFVTKNSRKFAIFSVLILLVISYFIAEYHVIINFLIKNIKIHRSEIILYPDWGNFLEIIVKTQYHSGSIYTIFIVLMIGFYINLEKKKFKKDKPLKINILILISIYFCSILGYLFYLRFDASFQWNRFYFLLPCFWIIVMALMLERLINKKSKFLSFLGLFCTLMTLSGIIYQNKELKNNYKLLLGISLEEPTYKQFFDVELFSRIKKRINKPVNNYRVLSLGIHPTVAIYNGFFTLDYYLTMYPLSYKYEFRNIIKNELDKDVSLKKYYDDWGSRCYLFSSDLWKLPKKFMIDKNQSNEISIKNLNINTYYSKKMGAQYIFSTVKINNSNEIGWVLIDSFTSDKSYWKIYLYEVQ